MERSLRVVKDGQRQKYKGQQAKNPGYNDTLMKKAYNLPPKCHEMWPMDHYHTETTN
jgi:hypothetical protein